MGLPTQNVTGLQWQNYTSDPANLIAPIDCDFTTYSTVSINPAGTYGQLGQKAASGVVIDNLLHGMAVVVTIGPLQETVPPYTKQTIALAGTTNAVQISGANAIVRASFFYGTFQGSSSGANYYAAQVQAGLAVATGMIYLFGGQSAAIPVGYLACDGSAVSRSTYSGLFAVIGTNFGAGDGSTTFNLPDMRGRAPIGTGTGTAPDATTHALGQQGGTETVTITAQQMPVHTHAVSDPGHAHSYSTQFGPISNIAYSNSARFPTTWDVNFGAVMTAVGRWFVQDSQNSGIWNVSILNAQTGITLQTAGGLSGTTQPTNVMQPFTALNFIIKT